MTWRRDLGAFWDAPYRPLFLLSFLCALLSVAWWPLGADWGLPAPRFSPAVLWHVHELIFGFGGAAIGGYLLTALPGWTGRPALRGTALQALTLSWLLARGAAASFDMLPLAVSIFLSALFFLGLSGFLICQLVAANAFSKLGFAAAVAALGLGDAVFLFEAAAGSIWNSLAVAEAILTGLLLLMFSIAARAVPAFTRNWFAQHGDARWPVQERPGLRVLSQSLLAFALVLKLAEYSAAAHAALAAAAAAMLWGTKGWQTGIAFRNPLLAALHAAFLWLPLGALTMGISGLGLGDYPMAGAVHIITIGAMAGLIMAVAGRAACHCPDGIMRAGWGFVAGTVLIWFTVWLRLAAVLFPGQAGPLIAAAALIWCIGWLAFVSGFLPALLGPVRRPVFSGRSAVRP